MQLKNSEMIQQRVQVGKDVKAGIDTYLAEIVETYSAYLTADLQEGETLPDTRTHLLILGRKVDREVNTLETLDSGVVDKARSKGNNRFQVDKLTEAVNTQLRGVRHACRGFFGPEFLERVGLKGEFPRTSNSLYQLGRLAQASLRDPDLVFDHLMDSPDGGDGEILTPARLADRLDPSLNALSPFVDVRFTDRRLADDVQSRRRQAIRDFDRNMVTIVQTLRAVLRAAGRDDLAARFRATYKRIVRRASRDEDPPPVSDTAVSDTPTS